MVAREGVLENLNYNEYTFYKGRKLARVIERTLNEKIDEVFATDLFFTMYLALPRLKKQVPESLEVYKSVIEKIMSSEYYQGIHAKTMYDEVASVVFGVEFYKAFIEELKRKKRIFDNSNSESDKKIAVMLQQIIDTLRGKHRQQQGQQGQRRQGSQGQQQQGQQGPQGQSRQPRGQQHQQQQGQQGQGRQGSQGIQPTLPKPLMKKLEQLLRNAVKQAVLKAEENVDNAKSLVEGFMAGKSPGTLDFSEEDLETVLRLAVVPQVGKILKLFRGIMGMMPKFTRKTKRDVVAGRYAGVTSKIDDLAKVMPSELALPDELFYEKWAKKSLLSYRTVAVTEKGGLYILIDKSGSMGGEKIIWAKAVALALLSKAVKEGRPFYLRFFDYAVYDKVYVNPRKARIHGFKNIMEVLRKVAMVEADGGTFIEKAILTAVEDIKKDRLHEKGISDIVIITDGEDEVSYDVVSKALRESKSKMISVMIDGDNPTLRKVSEKYMYAKLDERGALKIIEALER